MGPPQEFPLSEIYRVWGFYELSPKQGLDGWCGIFDF
jgi:hypothetical protein